MSRRALILLVGGAFAVILVFVFRNQVKVYLNREARRQESMQVQVTFDELRPVALKNCRLERLGEPNDGGYLTCGNLLRGAETAYSYGISGYDEWGCQVSTRRGIVTHQYDCFNTSVPSCPSGRTMFHPECVASTRRTEDGRPFDSIEGQMTKNGDGGRRAVMKMDIEGAEWDILAKVSDETLGRIDQLVIEFHDLDPKLSLDVIRRLKKFFYVAHYHPNNFSCTDGMPPFPSWAYEVTFVSKRLDEVDPSRTPVLPHPLDAPNNPKATDCPVR